MGEVRGSTVTREQGRDTSCLPAGCNIGMHSCCTVCQERAVTGGVGWSLWVVCTCEGKGVGTAATGLRNWYGVCAVCRTAHCTGAFGGC